MANQFPERARKVSFSLTKHYGVASVTIGLEDTAVINSLAEQAAVLNKLQDQVHWHFGEYERGSLLQYGTQKTVSDTKGLGANEFEEDATQVVKEVKGGKTYLYVKTKSFSQHGLAFYSDKQGYKEVLDMMGESFILDLKGATAVIYERGKVKKVERLLL